MPPPKRRLSGESWALNPSALAPKRQVQAVRDILVALERALKSAQLYPPGSPIPIELRQAFHDRLAEHLREEQSLPLVIVCDEIYVGDDLVYEAGRDERNFAFALFDGGIKELVFHEGIDAAETGSLVDALRQGIDSDAESVAALLWQRNLRHTSFVTIDLVGDDPDLEQDPGEVVERASAVYDRLRNRVVLLEQVVDMRRRGADGPAEAAVAEGEASPFALDPATASALRDRVHALDAAPLLTESFDLVRALLKEGPQQDEAARLLGLVRQLLPLLAESGDLGRAVRTIVAARAALDAPDLAPPLRAAYEALAADAASPEMARAVATRLRGEDAGLGLAYVRALGREAIRVAGQLLGRSGFDREILAAIGEATGGAAGLPHLRDHLLGEDEVAAWVAVRLFAEHAGERAYADLARAAEHRSPRVRAEAVSALARVAGARGRMTVLQAAADRDAAVRKRALDALIAHREGPEPELYAPLVAMIEDASFRDRSPEERRALLTVLAIADPPRGAAYLEAVLGRFHLFRRREAEDLKLLVAEALARAGTDEARRVLEGGQRTGSAFVQRACQGALTRFRADG